MKRRQLFAGTAVVAGLAGAALAWRSQLVKAVQSPVRGLVLPTPDGGSLSVDAFADRQVVLNFWATWCPPCVHELPLLSRFHLEHAQRNLKIGVFAGSWYSQPIADRIQKRMKRAELEETLDEINRFEEQLVGSGIIVIRNKR